MKKYTIEVTEKNGKLDMKRVNDGFNAFEVLGFLSVVKHDIIEMIQGKKKPDVITTKVITHKNK